MSNNKQSSVEWFWLNLTDDLIGDLPPKKMLKIYKLKEKAKAMHKEETIDFGNDLLAQNDINYIGMPNLAEQYYNETYDAKK